MTNGEAKNKLRVKIQIMSSKYSIYNAPYGTCRYCGFEGHDWGFKYHRNSCSKCYQKWQREQRAKYRKMFPNENVNITDKIVVTRNVKGRLSKKAYSENPPSKTSKFSEIMMMVGGFFLFFPLIYTWLSKETPSGTFWAVCIIVANLFIFVFSKISDKEDTKRRDAVDKRVLEMAEERQKQIEEAKRFYTSPEWKLLRKQIIKLHKNICKNCEKVLTEKSDITIDHILPRSKFPDNALEMENMQILCRSCNSSKGNKIIDLIKT